MSSGRALSVHQKSQISLLRSIADLQGSSVTDLFGSLTDLMGSANTLQGSANTLQASTNTLLAQSNTDLLISANTLQGSTNTLQGSLRDLTYKSKGNFYTHFDNIRTNVSTIAIGFTAYGIGYAISAGALGGATYSYDDFSNVHGSVYAGESLTFDGQKATSISVKCASTANPAMRIWAWG